MFIFVANVESTSGMMMSLALFLLLNTSLGPRILAAGSLILATVFACVAIGALINGWIAPGSLDPVVEWLDTHLRRMVRVNVDARFGFGMGHAGMGEMPMFGRASGYLARRRKARAEAVIRALHTEPYRTAAQLGALSSAELRAIATARSSAGSTRREEVVVEKMELAKSLELKDPCSICLDPWREGTHNDDDAEHHALFLRCATSSHDRQRQPFCHYCSFILDERVICLCLIAQ